LTDPGAECDSGNLTELSLTNAGALITLYMKFSTLQQ